jgi:hypothetical protein
MVIKVGELEFEADFNGWTPIAFSHVFKVETLDNEGNPTGKFRPKDINEDVGLIVESMQACGMPAMSALLEIFYACIKTATPALKQSFSDWVKSLPKEAFDLQKGDGWAADVMGIVEDNFFPSTPDGVEAAPAKKPRAAASKQS